MRYHGFVYRDGYDDSRPFDSEEVGLFETEHEAVAATQARLDQLPEDQLDADGAMFFVWRGLVERGEMGRVSRAEYDEYGERLLLEAYPEADLDDERPYVVWWLDHAYFPTQPYLAR